VDATRTTAAFYAPGPIVEAEIMQPEHPIFYGYSERVVPVRWANGPLLRVPADETRKSVLMRFPGNDKTVLRPAVDAGCCRRPCPAVDRLERIARDMGKVLKFSSYKSA
jgi:hypothetical protein